jgi:hypothetical protein
MDEYGDIQFVERNATATVYENGRPVTVTHPGQRTTGRTIYAQPSSQGRYPQHYTQQPHVIYASAPGMGVGIGGGSGVFGRMSTGQVIDMVAQIFAALMPLPAQPVATADATTDVGNLILFQGSLAQYAKRDEQIRTLGNLVTKLVG